VYCLLKWKKIVLKDKSKIIWSGSSWRLRTRLVTLPDGSTFERGEIEHPGSIVLVPIRETNGDIEVLMIRQYRSALDESILELPAGTRQWGEDWLLCAQRELREETGYRAEKFRSLGQVWPAPGFSDELMALYLALDLSFDPLPMDLDEMIELQPMPLKKVVSMAKDGRLRDGKSIVGILRAAVILGY